NLTSGFFVRLTLLLAGIYFICSGQQDPCSDYIKTTKAPEKKSRATLIFDVTDWSLNSSLSQFTKAELEITNGGVSQVVVFNFQFTDKGYPVSTGDILTLNYSDGSKSEVLYSERKSFTGKVIFKVIDLKGLESNEIDLEDTLYKKLLTSNIVSMKIVIGGTYRTISVSQFKSDLIKKISACLMNK
ncbi:MAG: hypothetical protein K2U26_04910, partial [Cyclobacteriaceae bacterium]|nr:hypothetical protein [Cyclobacteriaceae bacterium]